jgi:hypothetical protein
MDTLEIVVDKYERGYPQVEKVMFHVVVIDQELVQYAHGVVRSLQSFKGFGSQGHGNHLAYWFEFATDTRPTLIYSGATNVSGWQLDNTVSTRCVVSANGTPLIHDLMTTLYTRFAMPYWSLAHYIVPRNHVPDPEGFVRP